MSYPSKHNRLWEPIGDGDRAGPGGWPQRWKTISKGFTYVWSSYGYLIRVGKDNRWEADNLDEASDIIAAIERRA